MRLERHGHMANGRQRADSFQEVRLGPQVDETGDILGALARYMEKWASRALDQGRTSRA